MTDHTHVHVLIVDNDSATRSSAAEWLQGAGFDVTTTKGHEQAIEALRETAFDAIVVDMDCCQPGSALLQEACGMYPQLAAIATGPDSVERVVHAIRSGARDYLTRPFDGARLESVLRAALETSEPKNTAPRRAVPESASLPGNIMGQSGAMRRVFDMVRTIAGGNSTVLITGETGTGKELVAQAIHALSPRREEKLISINCGAIPENLLESELFGHVKGAFTGAHQARMGRFEQANGGTIFLDEIGNMSVHLQVKLLRVLQEREFERVGGIEKIKVNVRIIAATSANLKDLIARNEFRSDLYYRLNVIPMQMPPLRERRGDVPLLATHFMNRFCQSWGVPVKTISQEAMKLMMNYNWPGNVRELENAIERMVAMTGAREAIVASDLPEETRAGGSNLFISEIYIPDEGIDFNTEVSTLERKLILESLRKTNGNRREAADLLQLKRTTLIEKLRRFSIPEMEAASA